MNYLERLEAGYTKEEALEMDRMIIENRADELFHKKCCEGLSEAEENELKELEAFIDNYYQCA